MQQLRSGGSIATRPIEVEPNKLAGLLHLYDRWTNIIDRRLSMLSPHHVAHSYRQAHEACKMDGDGLPRASAVQELVATWKLLWKWRRKGSPNRG
jgi:hypothetical protein